MHIFNSKEQLFALLAEGVTVITPNNRLSDALIKQYFHYQNNKIVDKPICLPYNETLIKAYEQLIFTTPHSTHPTLLNTNQYQHLWRKLIRSHTDITYNEGLLQAVLTAWKYCEQWQISSEDSVFHYTPQTQQFQQWWQNFNQHLKQKNLITEYQLIPYLIKAQSQLLSQPVIWACFDSFTPQQHHLQRYLEHQGLCQSYYDLKEQISNITVFAAKNDREEYQQLIAWLQLKIAESAQHIGVVVPDLQQKSHIIQRTLTQYFDPSLFNISLGQPLSQFPLIAHALCWLNLDSNYLDANQATLLLQSPYLSASKEEFIARSEYLQNTTLLETQSISLAHFIRDLKNDAPKLATLVAQIIPYPKEATLHDWISLFQQRLNAIGFPGEYELNTTNYQCLNRFILLFDELRQLSIFYTHITQIDALEALQNLADNTIFQAQKTDSLIQVSGLLEASGCEFDHLWVMGLTDQCLPQKVHLSAFIPPQLQRALHMPHSVPERELHFAKQMLQRLQHSANSVVFSYATLQGDNANLPCSLITHHPPFQPQHQALHAQEKSQLIGLEETYNVPIKTEEQIHGGTALLANQAKCPFKAFAEHRLHAKELPQSINGLDTKTRGKIVHKIMELLWKKLQNQHTLFNLDALLLAQYINTAINTTLKSLKQQYPERISPLIQDIEFTRLKRLVLHYLDWEKQRSPFTIAALEQSFTINLAGLDFHVRVDRIDHVADKKWVIDYKSSLPGSKPWNEERPKEPQLLLYALLDKEINTLLLMQLKTGKISCSGFSEEKQGINGISSLKKDETWENYQEHWQNQLTHLSEEFRQGHCPPQPIQRAICQQCSFQNLCRFQTNE